MAGANEGFASLSESYLFPEVARRIRAFQEKYPEKRVLKLSIGNTTEAITPTIARAMEDKVRSLSRTDTYSGYGDEQGESALRTALSRHYLMEYGVSIDEDDFFISDGSKSDAANIQQIFSRESIVAVQDPAYPVYVDSTVALGRGGTLDQSTGRYSRIVYMPGKRGNSFVASPPDEHADIIFLCFPNNPTGAVAGRRELEAFVEYAHRENAVIVFDSAYSDYIETEGIPHSIYQIDGAMDCAIEIGSFSKNAGFTGVRLGWAVVPKALKSDDGKAGLLHKLWLRRQSTFFNGASNIAQSGGIAALSDEGRMECLGLVAYYKENARIISEALSSLGLSFTGGKDSPYLWLGCPDGLSSWEFFDHLLAKTGVAVTPGSGFGSCGEGYVRISSYGHRSDILEAVSSLKENL